MADCAVIDSPLGALELCTDGGALVSLRYVDDAPSSSPLPTVLQPFSHALQAYFVTGTTPKGLVLRPAGTDFQHRVWRRLREIPHGQTRTYGVLAAELDTSPRAVGAACRANPIAILIPCHRVVAAGGPGGYGGQTEGPGLARKQFLLQLEAGQRPS